MKKLNLFAIVVLVLAMLVTLCACNGGEDDAFDTTAKPNDTTTSDTIGNITPDDTTTVGQVNDTTIPEQSGDTSLPISTDAPNGGGFGELHPPKPKD